MRLFELDGSPLLVRLMASTSQLLGDINTGATKSKWTLPELLKYYRDNDIIVGKSDIYGMIKNPPLNKYISNIQGDDVIFTGQNDENASSADADENDDVVQSMAKRAMK